MAQQSHEESLQFVFKTADDFTADGNMGMALTMLIRGMVAFCEEHGCELCRSNGRSKSGRGRQYWVQIAGVNRGWAFARFRAHTQSEAIEKAAKALARHLRNRADAAQESETR